LVLIQYIYTKLVLALKTFLQATEKGDLESLNRCWRNQILQKINFWNVKIFCWLRRERRCSWPRFILLWDQEVNTLLLKCEASVFFTNKAGKFLFDDKTRAKLTNLMTELE